MREPTRGPPPFGSRLFSSVAARWRPTSLFGAARPPASPSHGRRHSADGTSALLLGDSCGGWGTGPATSTIRPSMFAGVRHAQHPCARLCAMALWINQCARHLQGPPTHISVPPDGPTLERWETEHDQLPISRDAFDRSCPTQAMTIVGIGKGLRRDGSCAVVLGLQASRTATMEPHRALGAKHFRTGSPALFDGPPIALPRR